MVVSKILGTGSAERIFKETKRVQTPTRNILHPEKTMKLTTIVGNHCGTKAERRRERINRAGKLFTDKDFETLKLDRYGVETGVLSGATKL